MKAIGILCLLMMIACVCGRTASQTPTPKKQIIIAASTVLDGKGGVLHNTRIVVEGSKIIRVDPNAAPVDYDLRGLTVLPGWIDGHVHITWSFGPDGKNAGGGGTTPFAAKAAAENARVTLMAGFTTVQSVGSPNDLPLRDAMQKAHCPVHEFSRRPSLSWARAIKPQRRTRFALSSANRKKQAPI